MTKTLLIVPSSIMTISAHNIKLYTSRNNWSQPFDFLGNNYLIVDLDVGNFEYKYNYGKNHEYWSIDNKLPTINNDGNINNIIFIDVESIQECCICYEVVENVKLPCNHYVCSKCFDIHVKKATNIVRCPICCRELLYKVSSHNNFSNNVNFEFELELDTDEDYSGEEYDSDEDYSDEELTLVFYP